jgi:predicted nucleotidyltransferase component of viral defense system
MDRDHYSAQVHLLVRLLPFIADEEAFALKGGTAINLFYRDLPRLSVDIDLTYLPVRERAESLADIDAAMDRLVEAVSNNLRNAKASRIAGGGGGATRLLVRQGAAEVKIETSPVTRGVVHEPRLMTVTGAVEDEFGFAEARIVAFEDLFGGKLHAALDRQHPRDLYDVKLLYENEGLTKPLFTTFFVYVASSPRPAHELLSPNRIDLEDCYRQEFEGMTSERIALEALVETRERLIDDIRKRLDDEAARFLLSLHDAAPDFEALGLPQAAALPAVRWKLLNLEKLKRENPEKHAAQRAALETLLQSRDNK